MVTCNLVCIQNLHDPITLPDGVTVLIGRSPATKITDPRCSRKQLELTANFEKKCIKATCLGGNSSAVDENIINPGESCIVKTSSTLYILTGEYPHKIRFEGNHKDSCEPENSKSQTSFRDSTVLSEESTKKRKLESTTDSENDSKKSKPSQNNKKRKVSHEDEKDSKTPESKKKKDDRKSKSTPDEKNVKATKDDKKSDTFKIPHLSKVARSDSENDLDDIQKKLEVLKQKAKCDEKVNQSHDISKGNSSSKERKKSGEPVTESKWEQFDKLFVYKSKGLESRHKIAGFDIDGTIITTQSGKVFPTHLGDWRILYPEVPGKLKKLHADGYKVVFFTNQMGVQRGKVKMEDLKTKFCDIVKKMGVPVQIMVSTAAGIYRKPSFGMWKFFTEQSNDGIKVNMDSSFYVGDAAGRPEKWASGKKKDFSCSDRLFALNIKMKFYTPEEFFLGYKPATFCLPDFDPRFVSATTPLTDPTSAQITSDETEMIVMVGYPASGKSFFCKKHLISKGYIHVNRDTLGTWQKCVNACKQSLNKGTSVVVDNTNPDPQSRARYVEVAKKLGVQCRCFFFTASINKAKHNERFREITDKSHQPINDMIMNSFRSKLKEPQLTEGFSEIVKINLVPQFTDPTHETLYKQFLMEK